MTFHFHQDAEAEFLRTVDYYENCRAGMGMGFAEEVYAAIARVVQFPDAWSPLSARTRRCLVNRFPFGIIYQVKPDHVRIIAIADLRRRPGYWRRRE